ncbi:MULTISPECIES: helix-turn-helix domain-containing protein [unclassified Sphingobium]|jgi:AraC family transcriptional regulator|uniref:helix-turn-helix domain-containing protein n=1 Tax=unclassified Sphingobium TaxID=2611147 RepID=UPI0035A64371
MVARTSNVTGEMKLPGLNVQVLDYRWDVDESISECEDDFILRYRPHPGQVSVAAHMKGGKVQDYGPLMFFPAHTQTETTPAKMSERTRNVMCRFTDDWFQRVWIDRHDWTANDLERCYNMHNFRIEHAMQRLSAEVTSPGFGSDLMVESLANLVAVEIARHFRDRCNPKRIRTYEGQFSARELTSIYDYIDSAINRCPTTEEISRECGISSAHLRRSFKKTTGLTLHEYVARTRLSKAQTILAETDLPLKEVAYRLGFTSSSTFSSTFRKDSGETPSGYRQRVRKGN